MKKIFRKINPIYPFLAVVLLIIGWPIYLIASYPAKPKTIAAHPLILAKLPTLPPVSIKVPILIYHYVEHVKDPKDTIRQSLNILPEVFDRQVKTLKDNGYIFLTPQQIPDFLTGKNNLPKKSVILTFDDGYRDFYTDVFPILKKYQARAVAYVVPGFINKPNNLTSEELQEISKSGLVEIGAHTMSHLYLKGVNFPRAEYEIKESKNVLEKELHTPIVSFAYPYGAFDSETIDMVKKAGFETAVTEVSGDVINNQDQYYLPRIRAGARVGEDLLKFLQSDHNRFR